MLQVGVCVVDDGRQRAVDCVESEECCRSACVWLMTAGSVRLAGDCVDGLHVVRRLAVLVATSDGSSSDYAAVLIDVVDGRTRLSPGRQVALVAEAAPRHTAVATLPRLLDAGAPTYILHQPIKYPVTKCLRI